jgi:cell division control protein 6
MVSSVFREEYKLLPDHLPERIPHREGELEQLRRIYSPILSPFPTPAISFLLGPVGTGKTMLARKLCNRLEEDGRRDGFIVKAITVNCRIDKGPSSVLNRMVESLGLSFPKRGYEVQETLRFLMDELLQMKARLLLVLDEVDSLVSASGAAFLYTLARINETMSSPVLSLLMISKDLKFLWEVDASTRSSLQKAVVKLPSYTADQLLSIILSRSEEALNSGVLDENTARLIAGVAADSGDARYALELLYRSAKMADYNGAEKVRAADVQEARNSLPPQVSLEELNYLSRHERIILLAAARLLKPADRAFVATGELEVEYGSICSSMNLKPRRHTMVWMSIQNLKARGFFVASQSGKGRRGRTTLIGLNISPQEVIRTCSGEE